MKEILAITVCPLWRKRMMNTRRTLLTFGGLMAAVALLVPATALAQPGTPTAASASPAAWDKLDVTWSADSTATTTGYRIFYRMVEKNDAGTLPAPAETNAATALNHSGTKDVSGRTSAKTTLTGLMPDTAYRVAIAPVDDGVVGTVVPDSPADADAYATTEPAPAPSPPRNVKAMGGDMTFTVMWEEPYSGGSSLTIKEYRVQKREVAGNLFGDWVPDMGDDKGGKKVMGDKTEIMFKDLENGITYQARVRAVNNAGTMGPWTIHDDDKSDPGDEAAMVGGGMTPTPALPLFGIFALFGGLLAAGRARLRR